MDQMIENALKFSGAYCLKTHQSYDVWYDVCPANTLATGVAGWLPVSGSGEIDLLGGNRLQTIQLIMKIKPSEESFKFFSIISD